MIFDVFAADSRLEDKLAAKNHFFHGPRVTPHVQRSCTSRPVSHLNHVATETLQIPIPVQQLLGS